MTIFEITIEGIMLRSWVQIPPGPLLSVVQLLYCFERVFDECRTKILVSHECDLKAMYANLTGHTVQQVQALYSIGVRW